MALNPPENVGHTSQTEGAAQFADGQHDRDRFWGVKRAFYNHRPFISSATPLYVGPNFHLPREKPSVKSATPTTARSKLERISSHVIFGSR